MPPASGLREAQRVFELRVDLHYLSSAGSPFLKYNSPRDGRGHMVVLPGACEAFRMVSEGLEKTTGIEHLDGIWGYGRRPPVERRQWVLVAAGKLQLD